MADTKISALTAATTPLAGTEVLPVVQSGATKKVSVANLTDGRAVATGALTSTSTTEGAAIGSLGNAVTSSRSTNDSQIYMGYRSTPNAFVIGASYGSTGAYLPILFATSDTARWQLETDGSITQKTANKGINFTANTPAAGMTSQLLNWYEEGTWTPTVTPATGSFTTVTAGTCCYTRIGRVVTVNARFTLTNSGTGAGAMTIAGLPFTISNTYDQNTFTGRIVNTGTPIFGQLVGGTATLESFQKIDGTTAIVNGNIYTLTATYTV